MVFKSVTMHMFVAAASFVAPTQVSCTYSTEALECPTLVTQTKQKMRKLLRTFTAAPVTSLRWLVSARLLRVPCVALDRRHKCVICLSTKTTGYTALQSRLPA